MDAAIAVAFVGGISALLVALVGIVNGIVSRPRRLQIEVEALEKLHGMLPDPTAQVLYEKVASRVLARYESAAGARRVKTPAGEPDSIEDRLARYSTREERVQGITTVLALLAGIATIATAALALRGL